MRFYTGLMFFVVNLPVNRHSKSRAGLPAQPKQKL